MRPTRFRLPKIYLLHASGHCFLEAARKYDGTMQTLRVIAAEEGIPGREQVDCCLSE